MTLVVDVDYATKSPWTPSSARLALWARAAAGGRSDAAPARRAPARRVRASTELAIRVVGPRESRRLNREWRGKDKATNVLSFPGAATAAVDFAHLGDLVICASVVAREAREQGKTLAAHWAHMVVHGTLHLLGFDHERDADAARMEGRERRVLARLGFPDPYRPTRAGT